MVRSWGFNAAVVFLLFLYGLAGNFTRVQAATGLEKGVASKVIDPNFPLAAPNPPTTIMPANGATNVPTTTTLQVHVTDPDNDNLQVSFYGRQKTSTASQNFTVVAIPDTQFYTIMTDGAYYFNAETGWIASNQATRNIVFVTHTGDITQDGDNYPDDSEWIMADTAMSILERDPANLIDDVPFSINPGNHDILGGALTHYNTHFPVTRFSGKPYYGGHFGSDNSYSYSLFSVSGMHFIVINLACTGSIPPSAVLGWAGSLLKDDVSRRGIVACHNAMDSSGAFSSVGQAIYNALRDNLNWFLMLAGHAGEARRTDLGSDGHSIYSLMADYEGVSGGSGYIRLMEFQPGANQIQVSTYSPTINGGTGGYKPGDPSQFILGYNMQSPDFNLINTVTVPSGSDASVTWSGLLNNSEYEWYAVARDATTNTAGPIQSFTTTSSPIPSDTPTVTQTPTATPTGATPTPTATRTPTPTPTRTSTSTSTPTQTLTPTSTITLTPTPTQTPTSTTTGPTPTPTPTGTSTSTSTPSQTPTNTTTSIPTSTRTPTPTPTRTPTWTSTPAPSYTPTTTITPTPTSTRTPTRTPTSTSTPIPSYTPTTTTDPPLPSYKIFIPQIFK